MKLFGGRQSRNVYLRRHLMQHWVHLQSAAGHQAIEKNRLSSGTSPAGLSALGVVLGLEFDDPEKLLTIHPKKT
jgi:hypothetical protein